MVPERGAHEPALHTDRGQRHLHRRPREARVVKEVSGNYFKIDAPMQPDYWLPARQIVEIEERQVRLGFVNEELGLHKLAEPAGT